MNINLDEMLTQAQAEIAAAADARALEQLRVDYLGKKGRVTDLLKQLGGMEADAKKFYGGRINRLKDGLTAALDARGETLAQAELARRLTEESVDVTLPGRGDASGGLHPITRTIQRIERLFNDIGFDTVEGPEIEDDFHNFGALNIPAHHPARAMHDTFYVKNGSGVLRTHTSPVQIRTLERLVKAGGTPPVRIIAPGRVYRSDSDRTHSPMFHQVEGLYVAENVSFADLQYDLKSFLSRFFEREAQVRFRPSYFPFTEPSAEVDIKDEKGRWLEVLGCGMVHPNVLRACGVCPDEYQGFAFGLGVDRFAMLKYGVPDLRDMFASDTRWLSHYGFSAFAAPNPASGLS